MFSRVMSNFRKKQKSSRKSLLKNSTSSPEVKIDLSWKFATNFNSDECLNATLSVIDNENLYLGGDKSRPDSGVNYSLINQ